MASIVIELRETAPESEFDLSRLFAGQVGLLRLELAQLERDRLVDPLGGPARLRRLRHSALVERRVVLAVHHEDTVRSGAVAIDVQRKLHHDGAEVPVPFQRLLRLNRDLRIGREPKLVNLT